MSSDGQQVAPPSAGEAKPADAKYSPIVSPEEVQVPGGWRRGKLLLATIVGVAAAAVAMYAHGDALPRWAGGGLVGLDRRARSCVVLAHVRLDNGAGDYSDATVDTPEACTKECRANDKCGQLIFSSESGGCFMFEEPNIDVYAEDDGSNPANFHSAFCGPESDALARQFHRQQALRRKGRGCEVMAHVRLADGAGQYSDATVDTPDDCTKKCQANDKCGQFIFSSSNGGCYMFEEPNTDIYAKEDGSNSSEFNSAFCGPAGDSLARQALHQEALRALDALELKAVQHRWAASEKAARKLVGEMDLETKMAFVSGHDGGLGYAGFLKPSGLPQEVMNLKMQDGPQGFNPYQDILAGTATQFPSLLSVAASFSPDVAKAYAEAVADEFVTKGANVLLGPDVEVTRTTMTGRCFETLSGEDPYLGSRLVKPFIQSIQARGIIATVKHWLDNNQEIYRQTMSSVVGERANHEIYMPVFKAAFEAGAGAVMCAYNKVNGHHACENEHLLTQLLRKELKFKGYIVSDWGATHNAAKSANSGLDVEMPNAKHMKDLPKLIQAGEVKEETVDTMATHVISAMHFVGQFEGRFPLEKAGALGHLPATTDAHRAVALNTLIEATVLLKNRDATLPLTTAGKTIAFIGKYCNTFQDKAFSQGDVFAGGGSGFVMTDRTITPMQGFEAEVEDLATLWSNDTSAGKGADVAIVCASAHSEEGWDRNNLTLPQAENFVKKLRKLPGGKGQKIIVLAVVPGAVTTEWLQDADAVLMMFGPGEQVGAAFWRLITGDASPNGRLPVSLPTEDEITAGSSKLRFTADQYPGLCKGDEFWPSCEKPVANFSEGVLVGYRWNDAREVPSAFPFGFGLTYTTFEFTHITARCSGDKASVTLKITNTGERDGVAVPQLYVGFPSLAPVVRQLRGFHKVKVAAGESTHAIFTLREEDWSFYDEKDSAWVSASDRGEDITVSVGSSSADLHLSSTMSCSAKSGMKAAEPKSEKKAAKPKSEKKAAE